MEHWCSERVSDYSGWHFYQCKRPVKVEREGKWYCTIHDPEYIKSRQEKHTAKYKSECCSKCNSHLENWYRFCPMCGTGKGS